jgi:hypothetical protein
MRNQRRDSFSFLFFICVVFEIIVEIRASQMSLAFGFVGIRFCLGDLFFEQRLPFHATVIPWTKFTIR